MTQQNQNDPKAAEKAEADRAKSEQQRVQEQLAEQEKRQQDEAKAAQGQQSPQQQQELQRKRDDAQQEKEREARDEAKARVDSQQKAADEAAEHRREMAERLQKLEQESADNRRKYEESAAEVAELRKRLDRPGSEAPAVVLRSNALDAEKSHARLKRIWPMTGRRRGAVLRSPLPVAKTFLVTPVGKNIGSMRPAIVTNCADEVDAKARFFLGQEGSPYKVHTRVEPYGETREVLEQQQRELDDRLLAGEEAQLAQFRRWQAERQQQQQQQTLQRA